MIDPLANENSLEMQSRIIEIENSESTVDNLERSEVDEIADIDYTRKIEYLNKELSQLGVVKRDTLDYKLTDEEKHIIDRRIKLQQQLHECYNARDLSRKISRIKKVLEDLSAEEIQHALHLCANNEELLIEKFTQDQEFLSHIRSFLAHKSVCLSNKTPIIPPSQTSPINPAEEKLQKKYMNLLFRNIVKTSKFKVDEGLEMLGRGGDPTKVFEGWSKARIMAFKKIEKKPNAYYYRFNAPGEKQGSGAWSNQEKQLFLDRLAEVGANGQWGIFSMAIPGRVGYQCANFYRHMIKTGEISDPNYKIDERGELRYLFGKREGGEGFVRNFARTGHAAAERNAGKKSRKKRRTVTSENEDREFSCPSASRSCKVEDINPIPEFIDAITMEEVKRPAISPYGHVLSYETWSRCLSQEPKNTCPLTKKPLSHRELVLLTIDNIEMYRNLIK